MRLSQASDFALRILMATGQSDDPQTVDKLSRQLGLAKSHVMKIVAHLAKGGYLETTRGRGGGIRLAKTPDMIRLGDVVRLIEPDLGVVACLKPEPTVCAFLPRCALKGAMARASEAFLESLNTETLASILAGTQMALPVETSA
ncbi:transcriptional regulator [Roseibium algicola]|jgi:Rrf2 family nitric oxide-sensitive transcriptional repressor|uniref:Transcriptional regulator n=1 Tax=Roseibium algicola TaxID=2857014 RepID=A0ABM6HZ04_9HYPH|nr:MULTISPECIES: Rrf2 family transcriptional regulator [Stappiaceae]MEC9403823.1 Rrf2 family transcriptional regulator [Pseudomonadota bacterium]AQQ03322.1 transcriptional regulator [Roseibium aggregatum]MBO6856215.1 Rrf2 family transcriptional regulator [Roseibium sp.]MBO9461332.1 Rrf2 family transcriptional regulator [Labrenzia sp. R5_0]MEC9421405.1 Rrf2 family transcriptional regulator [Pseudomonadota bacterium]